MLQPLKTIAVLVEHVQFWQPWQIRPIFPKYVTWSCHCRMYLQWFHSVLINKDCFKKKGTQGWLEWVDLLLSARQTLLVRRVISMETIQIGKAVIDSSAFEPCRALPATVASHQSAALNSFAAVELRPWNRTAKQEVRTIWKNDWARIHLLCALSSWSIISSCSSFRLNVKDRKKREKEKKKKKGRVF